MTNKFYKPIEKALAFNKKLQTLGFPPERVEFNITKMGNVFAVIQKSNEKIDPKANKKEQFVIFDFFGHIPETERFQDLWKESKDAFEALSKEGQEALLASNNFLMVPKQDAAINLSNLSFTLTANGIKIPSEMN